MLSKNIAVELASLKGLVATLQTSPGEFTPEDQKLVDELEARIASLETVPSDIPQYVPPRQPRAHMPAHSASPPNPSNPAFRRDELPELPHELKPTTAPNPAMAMTKVAEIHGLATPEEHGAVAVAEAPKEKRASRKVVKLKAKATVQRRAATKAKTRVLKKAA